VALAAVALADRGAVGVALAVADLAAADLAADRTRAVRGVEAPTGASA